MTKKIERSRVEAGKAELPRKAAFLTAEKVDYLLVFDREGELSVEMPAAALARLVKARGELKVLKGTQKQGDAAAAAALDAEREAHQATQAALARAERRIKALERKMGAGTEAPAVPGPAAPKASARTNGKAKAAPPKDASAPEPGAGATQATSTPQVQSDASAASAPAVAATPA